MTSGLKVRPMQDSETDDDVESLLLSRENTRWRKPDTAFFIECAGFIRNSAFQIAILPLQLQSLEECSQRFYFPL